MRTRLLIVPALLVMFAPRVHAQPFTLNWFTIDGGGGTSTGGIYRVSGTIGQPDAGLLSGSNHSVMSGFWGVVAVQTPGAPFLSVEQANGMVRVFWPTPASGYVLDETTTLTGSPSISWVPVGFPYQTNTTHIFINVPALVGNRFYRLRRTQ